MVGDIGMGRSRGSSRPHGRESRMRPTRMSWCARRSWRPGGRWPDGFGPRPRRWPGWRRAMGG